MRKPAYDDTKHPLFFPRVTWLNSHLSIARCSGGCKYNGVHYEVEELTGDLCREDVAKARRAAYLPEDLATIRAKHMQP